MSESDSVEEMSESGDSEEVFSNENREIFLMKSFLRNSMFTFKWTLEDFSKYENNKTVYSYFFYLEPGEIGFQVSCFRNDVYLYANLKRCSSSLDKEFTIKYTVTITDGKDKIWDTCSDNYTFEKYTDEYIKIVDQVECCQKEENNINVQTVQIILFLEMENIKIEREYYKQPTSVESFVMDTRECFSQDIANLLQNQRCTDVTLRVDKDSIGAHKAILSARSPVFAKMFEHDTKESQSSVVDIKNVDMPTLKELLAFLYSNVRCNYDFATALALYYAADRYEVLKLREVCAFVLTSQLDKENAGCVLKLADRHQDIELKKKIMAFINSNLKFCIKSDWWKDLMYERSCLSSELETFIAGNH